MIVGWRVASHMRTDVALEALELVGARRGTDRLVGLVAHSDAGSKLTSVRFTERLDGTGTRPSMGTVTDSFDNALAGATSGRYKAECVHGPDVAGWGDIAQLELAALSRVTLPKRPGCTRRSTTCRRSSGSRTTASTSKLHNRVSGWRGMVRPTGPL